MFLDQILNPLPHCEDATLKLCKQLGVQMSKTSLQKELTEHPDYPSMLSIHDVLNQFGMESVAVKLKPEEFKMVDTPFLAHIAGRKVKHPLFAVVYEMNEKGMRVYNPETKRTRVMAMGDFQKLYLGTLLAVGINEHTGDNQYAKNKLTENRQRRLLAIQTISLPVLAILSFVLSLIHAGVQSAAGMAFFILSTLIGSGAGFLLLWHDVDQYNPALKQMCSFGRKTNCSAILDTRAAKIWGISWSTIGFTYFSGQLILLLFRGLEDRGTFFALSWLSFLALPYVFFSIFYQWKVVKQWCVLCLSVQAVLVWQAVQAFLLGWYRPNFGEKLHLELGLAFLTAFTIPFIAVSLLIPALQVKKESRRLKRELQRFKHRPTIFEAILSAQREINEKPEGLGIIIGKPDAKNKLIKVCNPFCGPCSRAHAPLEELLDRNPDLQIQIIFTTINKAGDIQADTVKHLLAIAASGDEKRTRRSLDDWYRPEIKEYERFAERYPVNEVLDKQDEKITAMNKWCEKMEISYTPTFFVNGRQLPEGYYIHDLKYFLSV